jgi:Uma2 family endonuclease
MTAIVLNLEPILTMTEENFRQLCHANPETKLELTKTGELVIMPPTGGSTGNRNIKLSARLQRWTEEERSGIAFDSSTMFQLPSGAFRSPDAAWISLDRWNALTPEQQDSFPPICPDFVVELRSPSDNLSQLQEKMREYLANGIRLGWLIDPQNQRIEIYQPGRERDILNRPDYISGQEVLPGFLLELEGIL